MKKMGMGKMGQANIVRQEMLEEKIVSYIRKNPNVCDTVRELNTAVGA